jgi:YfiR/HmsC-like
MFTPLKVALILAATCLPGLRAQVNEYQVKAFFLYNFARYVEWPPQSFKSPTDPIVICILGSNPFGAALDQAVAGREVDGRGFVIRQLADIHTGGNCRILFVNAGARKRFHSIAANLHGSGVLTVGETHGFADEGGVVTFKIEYGKVRFEINVQAAEREHLRISSKLLSLAAVEAKNGVKQ